MSNGPEEPMCPICGRDLAPKSSQCAGCGAVFPEGLDVALDETHIVDMFMLLPGVGESKARALYESGYRSISQIKEAEVGQLTSAKGVSDKLAQYIQEHIESGDMEKDGLYLCPDCGAFISDEIETCPNCGVDLMEDVEDGEHEEDPSLPEDKADGQEKPSLFLCPGCGAFISAASDRCSNCGIELVDDEEEGAEEPVTTDEKETYEDPEVSLDDGELEVGETFGGQLAKAFGTDVSGPTIQDEVSEEDLFADARSFEERTEKDAPPTDELDSFDEESMEVDLLKGLVESISDSDEKEEAGEVLGLDDLGSGEDVKPETNDEPATIDDLAPDDKKATPEEIALDDSLEDFTLDDLKIDNADINDLDEIVAEDGMELLEDEIVQDVLEEMGVDLESDVPASLDLSSEEFDEFTPDNTRDEADDVLFKSIDETTGVIWEEEMVESEPSATLGVCTSCGAFVHEGQGNCEVCGTILEESVFVEDGMMGSDDEMEEVNAFKAFLGVKDVPLPETIVEDGEGEVYLCSNCGAFMKEDADVCSICGTSIEDMNERPPEHEETDIEDSEIALGMCRNCGAFVHVGAETCEVCGGILGDEGLVVSEEAPAREEGYEEDAAALGVLTNFLGSRADVPMEVVQGGGELFLCPNCGAFISEKTFWCPVCSEFVGEGLTEEEARDMMGDNAPPIDFGLAVELSPSGEAELVLEEMGATIETKHEVKEIEESKQTLDLEDVEELDAVSEWAALVDVPLDSIVEENDGDETQEEFVLDEEPEEYEELEAPYPQDLEVQEQIEEEAHVSDIVEPLAELSPSDHSEQEVLMQEDLFEESLTDLAEDLDVPLMSREEAEEEIEDLFTEPETTEEIGSFFGAPATTEETDYLFSEPSEEPETLMSREEAAEEIEDLFTEPETAEENVEAVEANVSNLVVGPEAYENIATDIGERLEEEMATVEKDLRQREQFMCPVCQTIVDFDAPSCPGCGAKFAAEEEEQKDSGWRPPPYPGAGMAEQEYVTRQDDEISSIAAEVEVAAAVDETAHLTHVARDDVVTLQTKAVPNKAASAKKKREKKAAPTREMLTRKDMSKDALIRTPSRTAPKTKSRKTADVRKLDPKWEHYRSIFITSSMMVSIVMLFVYSSLASSWAEYGATFVTGIVISFSIYSCAGFVLILTGRKGIDPGFVKRSIIFDVGAILAFALILGAISGEGSFAASVLSGVAIILCAIGSLKMTDRVELVIVWTVGSVFILIFALGALASLGVGSSSPHLSSIALGTILMGISFALYVNNKWQHVLIGSDLKKGDKYYIQKDYDSALDVYDGAQKKTPEGVYDELAWISKGSALIKLGRHDEAIIALNRALNINPQNEIAWNNKGNALSQLSRHDEALRCYKEAVRVNSSYEIAWNNMGNVYARMTLYPKAITCYNKAISLKPRYRDAFINKGYVLVRQGKYEEAIACANSVTALASA